MLKRIDSFFALIESGKADIKDAELVFKKLSESAKNSVFLQILDAKALCSEEQFFFAARHAIDAIAGQNCFSKRMEIELLLRITATRQIGKALEIAGAKSGKQEIAILGLSEKKEELEKETEKLKKEVCFKPEKQGLFEKSKKNKAFLLKAFGISEKELLTLEDFGKEKALEQAIIERIALNALNQ